MALLDVFTADGFSLQALTHAVNEAPYVPGRIGDMGLFDEKGVRTTTISVEKLADTISIIPSTLRGSAPTQHTNTMRNLYNLSTTRIALQDNIMADEISNVRAFGSESELQSLIAEVNSRTALMRQKIEATLEYHRIGALKGKVLDSDGATEIYNLFTIFNVSQQSTQFYTLGTTTTDVRGKCSTTIRTIEDALGGTPYSGVHAFCGSDFFDALVSHTLVRDTFLYSQGSQLREQTARRSLFFGGITFEEYRSGISSPTFIAADQAVAFPTGAPNVFSQIYSPADYASTVSTVGLPVYAKTFPDPEGDRYQKVEVQTNAITLCTRPRVLVTLDKDAS